MMDELTLHDLPVGVVIRDGDALVPNQAASALAGFGPGELTRVEQWFAALDGDDGAALRAAHERSRDAGFPQPSTHRFTRRDGTERIIELTARRLDDAREVWTLFDITERQLAGERFRVLFERSTDAHLLFAADGIIDCNQAAIDMLRCTDKAQLLATHPAAFSPERQPDGRSSLEKSVEMDAIARRDGFHRFDWIHRRMDGTDFPVEVTLNPVLLSSGPAVLVVWHDIAARVVHEQALADARDRAIEATRAKTVFLANMSHELRTPLNAIIGYSELLVDDVADCAPSVGEDLERINQAGRHLLALISDVLDLTKIEAGNLTLYCEWVDVGVVARDIVDAYAPAAARNGNRLVLDLAPDAGRMFSDAARLRQVLGNLVGNAAKFTQDGRVDLSVRRRIDDRGRTVLEFEVRDTGIGIAPEIRDRVFDAFVQGDGSTTRRFGGTGLGLAITHRLCEQLGGQIAVESEVGVGSTFRLRFAADVAPPERTERQRPPDADGGLALPDDAPEVVVIDDDLDARELLRRTLARGGFRALLAPDGATGVALCRRRKPVAITLDVLMPDQDGWNVLGALKADPELASIPVVMVSMVDDRSRGFALGAGHYLVKPIDREELIATVAKHLPSGAGTALVVEDDVALRDLVQRSLSRAGWRVLTAANGAEGLAALEANAPDVVLLDLMMPVMDGFEFLATVRSMPRWHDLAVVVLTARELSPEEANRLEGMAQRVLGKAAVAPEALLGQLDVALRRSPIR